MSQLRVHGFSLSLDGYAAGPGQDLEHPLGVGGTQLHEWVFPTRTFQAMFGGGNGTTGIDDDFAARGIEGIGAWILGRNMFGPPRGPWTDNAWKGWWGDNPPYHTPVFVLSHHARQPIEMAGGTTFHGTRDVRIGGGPATIRQYLKAGLVDSMHLAISPVVLGRGESLLAELDLVQLGYRCSEHTSSAAAMHVVLRKS
jgi:dihydrofolate reductase